MAPEQIIGSMVDRQKSDVYSFGILALELLSGVHPLQGINNLDDIFNEHIRGIRNELRKWPENIHPKLIHLLDRAISPNPNDRPNFQEINEHLKSAYGGPRLMLVSDLEKLSDSIEDASRKGKSLWAIGQCEAAASIIKSNLEADPFQGDLWYYLAKIEWGILTSHTSDLELEQITNRATQICAYAFRAKVLDEKFSKETHEDYKFINLIVPLAAGQDYIRTNDMEGYYDWGRNFLSQQREWLNKQEVKITESGGPVRCLCIRCGEIKMNIIKRCPRCGFLPTDRRDIYHTYLLRVESVRYSNCEEDLPYWIKLNYLRNLGRNIDKVVSELSSDKDYETQYDRFNQDEGRFLYQAANFKGSNDELAKIKDELARVNLIRPSKKISIKDKIINIFKQ
jgi:hypothetical protein